MNVTKVDNSPAIFIGQEPLAVIGILHDVARQSDLLNAIIVPNGYAAERMGLIAPSEVHIGVNARLGKYCTPGLICGVEPCY